MEKIKLPIGFIGEVATDDNTQFSRGIRKGTKFKILGYTPPVSLYNYVVKFLPEKEYKKLNKAVPYLRNKDIHLTKNMMILYGY